MERPIAPREGKSPAEQFLEMIQDPFSASFQSNAFWASLGTSLGITFLLALLFSLFRPRNSLVYAPKVKHADRKHAPPAVGRGLFAWLTPVLKTKEHELVDTIGLDATLFLRFTRMCRNILLVLSVIGCCIMIPINVTQSEKTIAQGLSGFVTMTPKLVFNKSLWALVVCSWAFDIIIAYFLWSNYRTVVALRKRYFQSSEYQMSLHARTLLIRHVPERSRSDEGLLHLTDEINPTPSIPRVSIGRNMKELPKLIAEHEKLVRQLEETLAKYFKNPDRLPPKRPTCRPSKQHKDEHTGDKVDAIDYLTDRIRNLEAEIQYVRESVDTRNAMPYGFASWESVENAHAVAYTARKKHPQGTSISLAPRPNDIIWENLPLTRQNRKWRRFTNFIWSTILTVLWIAPNAMIAIFLSDLSKLGRVWPVFQTELNTHPQVWAAVQGIAAPALTSLIYLILPIVFRRLSTRAGDISKTSRERHVIHSLYAFFVFNNLVVFSIFSAMWAFVAAVVNAKNQNKDIWEAVIEGEFYIKMMSALCEVSPFWVTWLLQRNLGAAIDLIQLINMSCIWFAKRFMTLTPRQSIEWTAPPPFLYASYYNYFLFYATIALCFATLQPIVLPVTAFYFAVDSWLKKYLLLYVFVTKTESGGQFWRVVYNRLLFAAILANCVTALVVKARGTWTMVFSLIPLPFLMLGFKWYCKRTFDDDLTYYSRTISNDAEALVSGKTGKKAADRVAYKFGHPALYKPLMTPMVHAKAADALEKIIQARQGGNLVNGEYSDIALHKMNSSEPGKPSGQPTNAPFEMVAENQLDFAYFKERPDFRDEFGGGIYGRPDDLISERSNTPKSFFSAPGTPGSSRDSSPVRSRFDRDAPPLPHMPSSLSVHRPMVEHGSSGFYTVPNESERRLLSDAQGAPLQPTGDIASLSRWDSDQSNPYEQPRPSRDRIQTSYEPYRGVQY
ncbi:hypothetical protein FQN53_006804 [Emmonsiellopsis sp. PD_33]|nr:hypothetical protein FQN53_006804 [Emmonsiellopsis sp. PD_33]